MEVTVDLGGRDWSGHIGVVPVLFYRLRLNPSQTRVLTCGPEIMMRFVIFEALARKISPRHVFLSMERNMNCAWAIADTASWVRRLSARMVRFSRTNRWSPTCPLRNCDTMKKKAPKLAVFKFASCDGCQLSLLDCEDELLAVAEAVDIAYFLEARTQTSEGPYDVGLVEGSITTAHDAERIQEIRRQCRFLVTIGACATSGGIQSLRNWANVDDFIRQVYAHPDFIHTLETSTPIADHVVVDFELRGCPINKGQLVELIASLLHGRRPRVPNYSVCIECKRRQTVCVAVAQAIACLGPVTQAGCGAICPAYNRECFGCYGPKEHPNLISLTNHYAASRTTPAHLVRLTRNFNGYASEFRQASDLLEETHAR